jgi:hypothetical protein
VARQEVPSLAHATPIEVVACRAVAALLDMTFLAS